MRVPEEAAPPKVVNVMDALKRSLDTVSASKKKPVKIERHAVAKMPAPKAAARKRARG